MNCLLYLRFGASSIQRLGDTRGTPVERHRGGYPCLVGTKCVERREPMHPVAQICAVIANGVGNAADSVLFAVLNGVVTLFTGVLC